MYILAISMRKEALYRAYCGKIEEQLNYYTQTNDFCFHKKIVDRQMNTFLTNILGGIFVAIFVGLVFCASGYAAWVWSEYSGNPRYAHIFIGSFVAVTGVLSIVSLIGFLTNGAAIRKTERIFDRQRKR